jgi:hypothetical protein
MPEPKIDVYASRNQLIEHGTGRVLETFSSHWAACAAMIRLSDCSFKSLSGDKAEDLEKEARL